MFSTFLVDLLGLFKSFVHFTKIHVIDKFDDIYVSHSESVHIANF